MDNERRKEVAKWGRDLIISVILVPAILAWFQMNPLIIAACALASLLILAAWENQFRFFAVITAVAVAAASIGWDYWYYSQIVHSAPRPAQVEASQLSAAPLDSASRIASDRMASRATKIIFACNIPPDPSVTEAERATQRKQFEKDAKAWGDTIGFSIQLSDIDGGYRLTIKAETLEAQSRLITAGGSPALSATSYMDFRRVGQQIVVAVYSDLPKGFEFFSLFPLDPADSKVTAAANNISKVLGVRAGTCRVI
jgi:hypothetical protein